MTYSDYASTPFQRFSCGGCSKRHSRRTKRCPGNATYNPGPYSAPWYNSPLLPRPILSGLSPCPDSCSLSLAGIITVVSGCISNKINLSHACIFAAGALLAASLLHIVPESLEGLESEFDDLHEMVIAAGTAILGGISIGVVLHALLATGHTHAIPVATPTSPTTDQSENPAGNNASDDAETLQALIMARRDKALTDVKDLKPVCWNLIIGDIVHNFADGVIIGAAFLGCSSTIGWTVTASTVLHEVPHELADFMALINGGVSMMQVRVKCAKTLGRLGTDIICIVRFLFEARNMLLP